MGSASVSAGSPVVGVGSGMTKQVTVSGTDWRCFPSPAAIPPPDRSRVPMRADGAPDQWIVESTRRGFQYRHRRLAALNHRRLDRKSTRLNSSHVAISYAVFCLKKKKQRRHQGSERQKGNDN